MKPERAFVAERRAAQHCAELLRRGPDPATLLPRFARFGERLARELGPVLAGLLGGDGPALRALAPREQSDAEFIAAIGKPAANFLFASGVPGVSLLASVDGATILRLVDLAFGGGGEPPRTLPDSFPPSAELLVARLEHRLAESIARALNRAEDAPTIALRRDPDLAELAPFPAGSRLALLEIEVVDEPGKPWMFSLALPLMLLPRLFGQDSTLPRAALRGPADPGAVPFSDMPLGLTAVLTEMAVPLATLATLAPGAILPLRISRAVALKLGDRTLAHGTVGEADDHVAIKLTQLS